MIRYSTEYVGYSSIFNVYVSTTSEWFAILTQSLLTPTVVEWKSIKIMRGQVIGSLHIMTSNEDDIALCRECTKQETSQLTCMSTYK